MKVHFQTGPLPPCPFCGGKAEILTENGFSFGTCVKCSAEGPYRHKDRWTDPVSMAEMGWNERAVNAHDALVSALKMCMPLVKMNLEMATLLMKHDKEHAAEILAVGAQLLKDVSAAISLAAVTHKLALENAEKEK